jgi:hypothetical protein
LIGPHNGLSHGSGDSIFSCPVKQSEEDSMTKNNTNLARKAMTDHVRYNMCKNPIIKHTLQSINFKYHYPTLAHGCCNLGINKPNIGISISLMLMK